jgi:Rho GTPase-activating protein 21/23
MAFLFFLSQDYSNNNNNFGSQTAEPQRIAATTVQSTNDEFSPIMSSKTQRKYGLGSRSPSGQSPVTKSRKTPHSASSTQHQKDGSDKEIAGSPKSKTWKGIMARQFRKIQGQPDSGSNNAETFLLEGASIGMPLVHCPPSEENQYVPLLIARCTSIVESKGLSVIGIYRIPGNTAAISALHELVNRGMDEQMLKDPRWEDVNVVSSLLKLFLRSLPDPLLPNDLYQHFIDADKHTGQRR